jgi:hypothetical protein
MSEDTDITDIRGFLGEAMDGEEPPHRDLAQGSITRGDAARRRNRVLGSAGGVTLSVAALVGTMALAQSGGGGVEPGSGPSGPPMKVVTNLNSGDREREQRSELPAAVNAILPQGVTLKYDALSTTGTRWVGSGSLLLTGKDGTDGASFMTEDSSTSPTMTCGVIPDSESLPVPKCEKKSVPGGEAVAWTLVGTASDGHSKACQASYSFIPTHQTKGFEMSLDCTDGHPQLSPEQFFTLVQQPGFDKVADLADLNKPASAAAKQMRVDIDTAIARSVGTTTLPAGYRLRLSTTNMVGVMDLVSPNGAITGFEWHVDEAGRSPAESCKNFSNQSGCSDKKVPGGRLIEGHSDADVTNQGFGTYYTFIPDGANAKEIWVALTSATSQPALTPDQFLAMAKTPGLAQIIAATAAEIVK